MMYYGGTGSAGLIWMGLSMILFWGVVAALVVWTVRSFSHTSQSTPPPSAALSILEERLARGEISAEEFTRTKQLILARG